VGSVRSFGTDTVGSPFFVVPKTSPWFIGLRLPCRARASSTRLPKPTTAPRHRHSAILAGIVTEHASEIAICASALVKTYPMGEVEVHALRGVDFELHRREIVVLLGPSGSGKSTLLNILGGLDVPTSGTLAYDGRDLSHPTEEELTQYRRRHIGFIFQFYNLIPSLTARENVSLVADLADRPMSPDDALGLVGLLARRDHYPSQMSGGEQQRVAIARAVVKKPEILLCDEPTGALDAATGRIVLQVLERVNRETGASVAIVTHNAPIREMAHRVVTLADGRIESDRVNAVRKTPSEIAW
jgi:putative ABC transport system ATP-binding protein